MTAVAEKKTGLEGMTKTQLMDRAKQKGIEVSSKAKKEDIIKKILKGSPKAKMGNQYYGES